MRARRSVGRSCPGTERRRDRREIGTRPRGPCASSPRRRCSSASEAQPARRYRRRTCPDAPRRGNDRAAPALPPQRHAKSPRRPGAAVLAGRSVRPWSSRRLSFLDPQQDLLAFPAPRVVCLDQAERVELLRHVEKAERCLELAGVRKLETLTDQLLESRRAHHAASGGAPAAGRRSDAATVGASATGVEGGPALSTCSRIARKTSRETVRSPASASVRTASASSGGTRAATVTFRSRFTSFALLTPCSSATSSSDRDIYNPSR